MVRNIKNPPFTIEDVINANTIYGCNVPTLKVKTVHQKPKRVRAEYLEVYDSLRESIGNMTFADDVMFVNGIPFLVSVLIWVNLTMV